MADVRSIPETMRAAVYRERGRITVEQRPVPMPGPHDVLLEVSHCGVCGTDLHMVMEGWGRPDSIGGHEYSGRIVALGSDNALGPADQLGPADELGSADENWKIGDAVVGGPPDPCGQCDPCRAGRAALCIELGPAGVGEFQGAFAEYVKLTKRQLRRVPEGLDLRAAALAEPLAVALHGITLAGVKPGQRALVTGVGPIGALTLAALRAKGVEDITVSEPLPLRRELAAKLGASRVVEPDALEVPAMPFTVIDDARQIAFECSGNPSAFGASLAQLDKLGTLVIVGTGMKWPRLDPNRVLLNELTITGAYTYDDDGFEQALELLASGELPTDLLIEASDVSLDGIIEAMKGLVAGRLGGKVLVAPR